ncbi:MAG: hypothetical protein A3J79_12195 [Elusimicrobia bacterium RIFOXYB2_FULL_62_6]|nr:MAG: hypothetical protein A3J79_12195 [Elusimicrobia bacterium RIFOXYB2_FULL_62_6]
MNYPRFIALLLLASLAGSPAFAQGTPWNAPGYSAEFSYFQERKAFTPEAWAALPGDAQERLLAEARKPARERREEVNAYFEGAAKKWDGAALAKHAGSPQDGNLRAVSVWLGKDRAEALARKLSAVKVKLAKAAQGLDDRDARDLAPYLTAEAIEELRAPRGAAEFRADPDKAAAQPPPGASASSLKEFTAEDPSSLNADSFSKLYDGMRVSGREPVLAGGPGHTPGRSAPGQAAAAAAQKKSAFAIPQLKAQPAVAAAKPEEKKSTALTSDAYGFTITAGGQTQTFRDQQQAEAAIRKLPAGSVTKVIFYGHGAPGMQTVGPASYDAETAGRLLQTKMAKNGVIQFSGCNTASIGGATLNPAVGLSMVTRRLLYFSLPYFQDRLDGIPADEARLQWEKTWNLDLALDTSLYVKDAVVCGYRTFGIVPGRMPLLTRIFGNQEATTPGYVAGKKACYKNGREVPAR